jgi:endonuclease YncB( thermonuclease family)
LKILQAKAAEPLGPESVYYLRDSIMQQEVELEADEVDKNGVILGPIWVGKGGARKNVAVELLRNGFAYGIYPVIEKVRDSGDLISAEAEAKGVKRGVWEHYTPPEEDEAESAAVSTAAGAGSTDGASSANFGTVCEVISGMQFCMQTDADLAKLEGVTAKLDVSAATL